VARARTVVGYAIAGIIVACQELVNDYQPSDLDLAGTRGLRYPALNATDDCAWVEAVLPLHADAGMQRRQVAGSNRTSSNCRWVKPLAE
jgi:hypothetical protein